jgi:hypothetical protein
MYIKTTTQPSRFVANDVSLEAAQSNQQLLQLAVDIADTGDRIIIPKGNYHIIGGTEIKGKNHLEIVLEGRLTAVPELEVWPLNYDGSKYLPLIWVENSHYFTIRGGEAFSPPPYSVDPIPGYTSPYEPPYRSPYSSMNPAAPTYVHASDGGGSVIDAKGKVSSMHVCMHVCGCMWMYIYHYLFI